MMITSFSSAAETRLLRHMLERRDITDDPRIDGGRQQQMEKGAKQDAAASENASAQTPETPEVNGRARNQMEAHVKTSQTDMDALIRRQREIQTRVSQVNASTRGNLRLADGLMETVEGPASLAISQKPTQARQVETPVVSAPQQTEVIASAQGTERATKIATNQAETKTAAAAEGGTRSTVESVQPGRAEGKA